MAAGGWVVVEGALRLVDALDVDQTAVGLTVVALATTLEFVALLWSTARRGTSEIAVAGIIGSVLYNATVSLGAAAVVRPLPTGGAASAALLAPLLVAGLLVVARRRGSLGRPAGLLLALAYVTYVVVVL